MSATASLQNQAAKSQLPSSSTHAGLLLQRKCACGSPTSSLTGECAECKSKKRLQTKLTIGASNDPLEQEADRVAYQVMAAPAHSPASGAPPHIQRFTGQPSAVAGTTPASVDRVLSGSGSSLEPALRHDMEQRFGHDFSRVRVHSEVAAEQSARDLNAHAYAVGHDIVFGANRFAPGTHDGRRLIAHELAHIVQQRAAKKLHAGATQEQFSNPGDGLVQRDSEFDVPTLDHLYNKAVENAKQTGNWQDAAEKLNGFNRQDIQARLATLTSEEVGRIHLGAIDNQRVGPDSNIAQLTKPGTPRASTVAQDGQASKTPQEKSGVKPAQAPGSGEKPTGVLKIGGTVVSNSFPTLATVAGVLVGGNQLVRGVLTVEGTVFGGGAEVIFVQSGTVTEAVEAVKVVTEVGGLDANLLRQTLALRAALAASTGVTAAETATPFLIAAGGPLVAAGIGFSIGVGIVLLPFAMAYAAQVLARLGPFGGTLPPGGTPPPPMQEPGDVGEAQAPGSNSNETAKAPGQQQGGPALAPGTQGAPAVAPGQATTPAQLGPGIQNVPKTKSDDDAAAQKAREEFLKKGGQIKKFEASPHWHHLFPEDARLQKYWDALGINNQDPKYLVWLNPDVHLKDVHGGHSDPGGLWNATWLEFFQKTPGAKISEVLDQMAEMRKSFGI